MDSYKSLAKAKYINLKRGLLCYLCVLPTLQERPVVPTVRPTKPTLNIYHVQSIAVVRGELELLLSP